MLLEVYNNKEVFLNEDELLKQYSNKSLVLEFKFGERWSDWNKYLEIKIETAEEAAKWDRIIENNRFEIPAGITKYSKVLIDVRFEKTDKIETKVDFSKEKVLYFEESINADEPLITEEHKKLIDDLITKLNKTTEEVEKVIESGIKDYNENATEKIKEFNTNAQNELENYNKNDKEKTENYNKLAEQKENDLNDLVDTRAEELNNIKATAQDFVSAVTFSTFRSRFKRYGNIYRYTREACKFRIFSE